MSNAPIFEHAVVGNGLIGCAAARYLSHLGQKVLVVGPDEPKSFAEHQGVFASHYDSGRITRILDTDHVWGLIAKRSIERYRSIEAESLVPFFEAVGCMKIVPDTEWGRAYLAANEKTGKELSVKYERLDYSDLQSRFPYISLPADSVAILESETAGHINPRMLIKAQNRIAEQRGVVFVKEAVTEVRRGESGHQCLTTNAGNDFETRNVLVTAGAFSNFNNLLPRKLDLTVRAETIVLMKIEGEWLETLREMPCLIWFLEGNANLKYVYSVPPVKYPDGNYYLKIGGDREVDHVFESLGSLEEWFGMGGGTTAAAEFEQILRSLLPAIPSPVFHSKPCVISDTVTQKPYIGRIDEGIFVGTGGCGAAAKSSDEIGRLAALIAEKQEIDPTYGDHAFQVAFADSAPHELHLEPRKFSF